MEFTGVKAALFYNDNLLVYQRDDKPGLRFAGLWDFFGGGREGHETVYECIARELREELEITIEPSQIIFQKTFPAMHDPSLTAYFVAIKLTDENVNQLHFGSEGQQYSFTSVTDFFTHNEKYVPFLKQRLESYLEWRQHEA